MDNTGHPHHSLSFRRAAVLGHPITHSLSPSLHQYWLTQQKIEGDYLAIDTPESELSARLQTLKEQNFAGVNLTIPLKEAVLPLLDSIDETANNMGAVNTVIFKDGKMHGINTDAFGFIQNLKTVSSTLPESAFIFGAGGAARAVIIGLIEEGIKKIMICNRNQNRAEELAIFFSHLPKKMNGNLQIKTTRWDDYKNEIPNYSLIINTTSLGMKGQPPLEVNFSESPNNTLVTDIVYNPLTTPFLQNAKNENLKTVDGLGMLLYQGQKAFEYFYGLLPEVTQELREKLLEKL